MADDFVSLGIGVDSSQMVAAKGEADKLAGSLKGAAQASDDLAKSGAVVEGSAKGAGTAFKQMQETTTAATGAVDLHTAAVGKAAAAHGTMSTQAQSLFHAVRSMGEGIAMGIPPTQLLTQQINHLSYAASGAGGLTGAFGELASSASKFITPLTIAATATLALGGAAIYASERWASGQRDIERAMIGIGGRAGATADDINKIAASSSSAFGLSNTEARNAALEFAKTGQIYSTNIGLLTHATENFAKLMGVDAPEASKILAKAFADPIKGAQDLNKELGFLDGATLGYIRSLVIAGDKQGAQRALLDAINPSLQKAAGLTSAWGNAWTFVKNTSGAAFDAIGKGLSSGAMPSTGQLDGLLKQRSEIQLRGTPARGSNFNSSGIAQQNWAALSTPGSALPDIDKQIAAMRELAEANEDKRLGGLALVADDTVRALIPEIDKTNKLTEVVNNLKQARDNAVISGKQEVGGQNQAAINAGEVILRLTKDQTEESARHNAKVLEIAGNYQGVSTQTALTLDLQKQQLAVASAVTGEERRSAQEALQRYQLDLQGKDGAVIAAGNRQNVEAQITSRVQAQLLAMRDQLAVAQAVTGAERMRAEAAATTSALTRDIGDASLAQSVAAAQQAIAEAQISSGIQNQVSGLSQQTELIRARANGSEAAVAAAQAYTNAIKAGATETDAAAISAAVLANNVAKAEGSARSFSASMKGGMNGGYASLNQWGNQTVGMPGTDGTPFQRASLDAAYGPGGYSTYLNGGSGPNGSRFDVLSTPNAQGMAFAASQQLRAAALKNMDAVTAAKFKAGSFKLPASDAQAIANAYLAQGSHSTSATSQKAAADFVSQYGDNSSSSASSGLSPLYLSSSGSTNLGFRAAEGMDYTVPGSGPVDSVKVSGMVSPGERMIMIPPGGAAPRDMQGGNTQSRPSIQQTINISAPSMQGASDTMSQLAARASRAAYAASRHR